VKSTHVSIKLSKEEVIKIKNGQLTQIRKLIKPTPSADALSMGHYLREVKDGKIKIIVPSYKTGDLIYVREPFKEEDGIILYQADYEEEDLGPWKPASVMNMEKRGCGFKLQICIRSD